MLTYCTNIHPAESWQEVVANVWPQVFKVKERVSPKTAFPVGLRLSARAAREATPEIAARFLETCAGQDCFIPTINGFPYGDFHQPRVKELAYLPDWRSRDRVSYTLDLIRLLQVWLPEGTTGSISTVPIGSVQIKKEELPLVRKNLICILRKLEQAAMAGKRIVLALEPEPGCWLETGQDLVAFFENMNLPAELSPFLGVCYDLCHAAVMFEEPRQALALLKQAGIPVVKIQVSSAARILNNHLEVAPLFHEPRYLHQTTVRNGAAITRYGDLGDALAATPLAQGEWRIHFHLPIFDEGNSHYKTTNHLIAEALQNRPPEALLEIETYTYDVLPKAVAGCSLPDFIGKEFRWLRSRL